jgi:hypothetical protein
MQTTSAKWMSLAKEHQKALDNQIKEDGKAAELNKKAS